MAIRSVLTGNNQGLDGNTSTTGASPVTFNLLGTEVAGDRFIVATARATGSATCILDNPTGYETNPSAPDRAAGAILSSYIFDKVLTSGDVSAGSINVDWSTGARGGDVAIVWAGAASTTGIFGTSPVISTSTTTPNAPTLTTTINNSPVFCVVCAQNTGTGAAPSITLPSGYTQDSSVGTAFATGANFRTTVGHLTTVGTAGSYGGGTVTIGGTPAHSIVYTMAFDATGGTTNATVTFPVRTDVLIS